MSKKNKNKNKNKHNKNNNKNNDNKNNNNIISLLDYVAKIESVTNKIKNLSSDKISNALQAQNKNNVIHVDFKNIKANKDNQQIEANKNTSSNTLQAQSKNNVVHVDFKNIKANKDNQQIEANKNTSSNTLQAQNKNNVIHVDFSKQNNQSKLKTSSRQKAQIIDLAAYRKQKASGQKTQEQNSHKTSVLYAPIYRSASLIACCLLVVFGVTLLMSEVQNGHKGYANANKPPLLDKIFPNTEKTFKNQGIQSNRYIASKSEYTASKYIQALNEELKKSSQLQK